MLHSFNHLFFLLTSPGLKARARIKTNPKSDQINGWDPPCEPQGLGLPLTAGEGVPANDEWGRARAVVCAFPHLASYLS